MTVEVRRSQVLLGLALFVAIAVGLVWAVARGTALAAPSPLLGIPFRDQTGAWARPAQLRNQALLVHFVFTRCGSVCPLQTRQLARMRASLPSEVAESVTFLSISIDPAHDTPLELARFAEENGATQPNWSLLVASPEATEQLLAVLAPRPSTGEVIAQAGPSQETAAAQLARHDTDLYLYDGRGRLVQRYAGSGLDSKRLVADVTQLVRLAKARQPFPFKV